MAEIIVVEDEPDMRAMLLDYLGSAGHRVRAAADGAGLRRSRSRPGHLVVLDVGLPGEDGLFAGALAARAPRPRHRHADRRRHLAGPHPRPGGRCRRLYRQAVRHGRAAARIDAVLRRRRPPLGEQPADGSVRFGRYRCGTKRSCYDGLEARCPAPMELELVAAFAPIRPRLQPRGPPAPRTSARRRQFDRSVDNRVTRLRKKLEPDPTRPELIKTSRGAGYIYPG